MKKERMAMVRKDFEVRSFDGARLRGTLDSPESPKAVLITVHGSLLQTRDGDLDGAKTWMFPKGAPKRRLFVDVACIANACGVGVYRYDKRASGESGGHYEDTDLEALARDIRAVFDFVKGQHPDLPVGVLGQSEAGFTVLRAWEIGVHPDFLVLQGAALEPLEIYLEHQRTRAAAPFLSDGNEALCAAYPYLAALYRAIFKGDFLTKMADPSERHYLLRYGDWSALTSLDKYRQNRWNGMEKLLSVTCPTLVLFGEKDANVRPESGRILQRAQQSGLYPNVSVHILPGLEHSFREVRPGENFVDVMKKPISPLYGEILERFLRQQAIRNVS